MQRLEFSSAVTTYIYVIRRLKVKGLPRMSEKKYFQFSQDETLICVCLSV
jgi:hypothetical protein